MTCCQYFETLPPGEKRDLHKNYHDNHYGFPPHDDNELFGRLVLEINHAGLNWQIILKKEQVFRKAFSNYWLYLAGHRVICHSTGNSSILYGSFCRHDSCIN
ncbi:MAG TPA: hypothetical protein DEO60_11880 [Bacteroidales bacterium]|jgi:3-methyladenine DNA glycosylase Tag|nr:hypothetical protein [Bacteroidales bacterium]HBZ21819.1 hypothetical protein [Bacteroidales bacterium]